MTDRIARDLLRELRAPVVPVEVPEVILARRARGIARLREVQRRELSQVVKRRSRKKFLMLAALVLLPAGALAATFLAARETSHVAAATEPASKAAPARPAPAAPEPAPPPVAPLAFETLALAETAPAHAFTRARQAPAEKSSTLAAENALMQSALRAARKGDDARAASLLSEFLSRYPNSQLAQNAEVERFRAHYREGNVARARELAQSYLGNHPDGMAEDEARLVAVTNAPRSSGSSSP